MSNKTQHSQRKRLVLFPDQDTATLQRRFQWPQTQSILIAEKFHYQCHDRYPLELGTTRPPQSQWTVTGAGGALVACEGDGIKITAATLGKVVDYGITDVNNMGAAMAPVDAIIAP